MFDRSIVSNQKGSVWSTRPLAPKHLNDAEVQFPGSLHNLDITNRFETRGFSSLGFLLTHVDNYKIKH